MSDDKRSGSELLDEPLDDMDGNVVQTPFDQTVTLLATTRGESLELFCRANSKIAEAAQLCYNMQYRFHSNYIAGRINQIMRFSVGLNGQGRSELVQSLQAGSGVPDAFYESQNGSNVGFMSE